MAMYTNIGGTSKELEYLRFNKDGAIQGITDAYANIDANSKKIFGTIKKSYWWKKYPCTEYELVKMAIGDIPLVNNTSAMTDMTLYNYGNISDGKYMLDGGGSVIDGVLYVSDESVLNSFNKSSRQGVSPYRRYSPQAVWLIWLNSRADSYSLDGRRFVFDILFF